MKISDMTVEQLQAREALLCSEIECAEDEIRAMQKEIDSIWEEIGKKSEVTPNAKSQATAAALSRQVACTDGLCGNGNYNERTDK